MYSITATVTRTVDGWTSTHSLPTFYLHPSVQGIVSEDHAARIAHRMLSETAGDGAEIHASATLV
jgi:hypothetical protein